jgi:hypothetical protein
LNRNNCETIIRDAGLPPAPKSACWFCPWTRVSRWSEVRRDDPERFEKSADLEEYLSDRSIYFGHGALTLSDTRRPLRSSIPEAQTALFDMDGPEGCDEGHCWT